ncbi:hypothetical protein QOM21_16220 [Streptomyces sp. Pv4-95]|uniref:hypothetical protein n=1 Tax=Streptomyces sp. Pv4-95 TaxID=3049543 RepID=UPI003891BA5F
MPRGRHRHSPPLHRLLPPSTVAGASIACAASTWLVGDDLVQRVLAAGAAGAAVTGAVLLRAWDRKAGKRVAELTRARVRDEWRTEERIAELETDVEESREIRTALDTKLRAKRAELARLRSEHAELLRRYATAETERATALEGRRLLAIEAAAPARAALPAAGGHRPARHEPTATATATTTKTGGAPADGPSADGASADRVPGGRAPADSAAPRGARPTTGGPASANATFAQADQALRQLARNAAKQRETARNAARAPRDGSQGSQAAGDEQGSQDGDRHRGNADAAAAPAQGGARHARRAIEAAPALRPVPAAATAVAPYRPTASRALGGFDFFGTVAASQPRQLTSPLEDDLADVVGDEALAEQSARAQARAHLAAEASAQGRTENSPEAPRQDAAVSAAAANGGDADGGAAAGGAATDGAAVGGAATDGAAVGGAADEGAGADGGAADGEAGDGEPGDSRRVDGVGAVIDLTAHDETEQFDVAELRSAIS